MSYTAETIPSLAVKNLLLEQWDKSIADKVPLPIIIEQGENIRVDLKRSEATYDVVRIFMTPAGERETYRNGWQYSDMEAEVVIKISSAHSRQRLYDIMQQIRRIIRVNKHNRDYIGTMFQAIRYDRFQDDAASRVNNWEGIIYVRLVASGVPHETV